MATINEAGIPLDPEAAVQAVKEGKIEVKDEVEPGLNYGVMNVTVKDEEGKEVYSSGGPFQPFAFVNYEHIFGILENEGATLDDTTIDLIGSALSGDKNGKALKNIVNIVNSVYRANAKQAEYARITNLKKPMSEETKAKKVENMIQTFAMVTGVSLDAARTALKTAGAFKD